MRKILLLVPLLILLFGFKSLAYVGPTGNQYQHEYVFTEGSNTLRFYSNYLFFGCSQNNSSRPELCAYIPYSASVANDIDKYYVTSVTTGRNTYYMYTPDKKYPSIVIGQDTQWITWAELKYNNGQSTANWPVTWTPQIYQTAGVPVFTTYESGAQWAYSEMQPDIEWDSPQYNPNMPIPEFTTNYGEISVNSSSPEIPFDIEFVNPSSDYYIEVYVNYWIPDNMSISINRTIQNNDGYVYKALSRELVNDYLIDPEQMLKISGINNFKLQLKTSWENALSQVPESSIEYANPNNLPSGMFTQYKNSYEDYCRRILGFYGSQFTIMMRYFTIVNDTEYVIGAWRTWTSYSPNEFTERIPDYYVPYVPASGQENITNDVDPETVSVVTGTGTNTGVVADPNYYITVNQNTPNYPDYPTVASYNKDNLLLDTINQMNSLSSFFGQFGEFLTLSFSFFPAWIWAIIGVGFSISIVVMFLKIL